MTFSRMFVPPFLDRHGAIARTKDDIDEIFPEMNLSDPALVHD